MTSTTDIAHQLLGLVHTPLVENRVTYDDEREQIVEVDWTGLMSRVTLDNLSGGERVIVVLAHDLYAWRSNVGVYELFEKLDSRMLGEVLAILVELKPGLVLRRAS